LLGKVGFFAAGFRQHMVAGQNDVTEMLEAQSEITEEQKGE